MRTRPDLALTLVRVIVGLTFLAHGSQKLFVYGIAGTSGAFAQMGIPMPVLSAYLATCAEFFGGLALLLGLFTRVAAIPVAFTMIVAIAQVHMRNGFFLPKGFEYALVLLISNIALVVGGGGAYALDNLLFRPQAQETRRPTSLAA